MSNAKPRYSYLHFLHQQAQQQPEPPPLQSPQQIQQQTQQQANDIAFISSGCTHSLRGNSDTPPPDHGYDSHQSDDTDPNHNHNHHHPLSSTNLQQPISHDKEKESKIDECDDDSCDENMILDQHADQLLAIQHQNMEVDQDEMRPRELKEDFVNYSDLKSIGGCDRYFCPIVGLPLCEKRLTGNFKGWKGIDLLRKHIQEHCNQGEISRIPDTFWLKRRRDYCFVHRKVFSMSNKSHAACSTYRRGGNYQHAMVRRDIPEPKKKDQHKIALRMCNDELLPEWNDIIKYNLPAINNVPKKLKSLWVHIMDQLFDLLLNENSDDAWKLYMMTAKVIFHDTDRGGHKHINTKVRIMRQRMDCWLDGKFGLLWRNYMNNYNNYQLKNKTKNASISNLNSRQQKNPSKLSAKDRDKLLERMVYYAKCGDLTGAVQSLYSNGICPLNESIKTQLIAKHPHEDEYKLGPDEYNELQCDPEDMFSVDLDDAKKILIKTKVTKAPGVDGWKPYYLRSIIGHYNEDRVLTKLVAIWRNIIDGRLPPQMARFWSTSKGTPLAMNKQKTKARPLASGICLRRCLTAIFVSHYISKINDIIFPLNIGDARNGTELMTFTLRTMITHDELNCKLDGRTVIKHDIENAFNTVHRTYIRKVVKMYTPGALPYFDVNYQYHSKIIYRDDFVIDSTRGFQQGDGLSIYFPLVIYDIFRDDQELAKNLLNLWYHDDGISYCDISLVENNINYINERLKIAGMNLSVPKTEIYTKSDEIEIIADLEQRYNLKINRSLNFECLGSFVGDLESSRAFLNRQYNEYCNIIDILKYCNDKHVTWSVLYYCLSFAKNNYLLRTMPMDYIVDYCARIDVKTRELVKNILEVGVSESAFIQISLPFKHGGMGLRALTDFYPAATIAAWSQCRDRVKLIILDKYHEHDDDDAKMASVDINDNRNIHTNDDFDEAVRELDEFVLGRQEECNLTDLQMKNQKLLSIKIADSIFDELWEQSSSRSRARLVGCRAYNASAWISTLPMMHYKLSNDEFMYAAKTWLGLNVLSLLQSPQCRACKEQIGLDGIHTQLCRGHGGLTRRHNRVRNFLHSKYAKAGYITDKEKYGLCHDQKRPADIYVLDMDDGKHVALDVSVTCPLTKHCVDLAHHSVFDAATDAKKVKLRTYGDVLNPDVVSFKPLIFESFGGCPDDSQSILRRLATDLQHAERRDFNSIYFHLKRKICILIWRMNWDNALQRISWDIGEEQEEHAEDFAI